MKLTEDEIRPQQFAAGKNEALQADLAWLRQRRGAFVEVPCPACLAQSSTPAFEKFGFTFVTCSQCRTVYMTPRAPAALMGEFYSRSVLYEYWNEYHLSHFPRSAESQIVSSARAADCGAL